MNFDSENIKEIGGYFGLESLIHNEYYPNLIMYCILICKINTTS